MVDKRVNSGLTCPFLNSFWKLPGVHPSLLQLLLFYFIFSCFLYVNSTGLWRSLACGEITLPYYSHPLRGGVSS